MYFLTTVFDAIQNSSYYAHQISYFWMSLLDKIWPLRNQIFNTLYCFSCYVIYLWISNNMKEKNLEKLQLNSNFQQELQQYNRWKGMKRWRNGHGKVNSKFHQEFQAKHMANVRETPCHFCEHVENEGTPPKTQQQ